ncbi:invasion associated locus B family protein [Falsigemmobacter intermedius]|uniref:Invasion associated locus B family protein n=1 Tax=Falsigemmobacter intermedius TaxID=1553448 RepID=A0A3S3UTX7_9RHOB|nr:invasion associated locus B family protein [Falsigemmobacter intermedius]RWY40398.1 hypothetical protein EP867_12045 [Falsigemmobacter intermedius]
MTFSFASLSAVALTATLAFAPVAVAQTAAPEAAAPVQDLANYTAFGSWLVNCEALSVKRSVCRLTQELTLKDSGELVVRLVALPVKDGALLFAQVPQGVYLPGGAVYRIADKEDLPQREMIWQRCLGGVCEAATGLDEAELETLSGAESVLFGYRMDADGEPLIVKVEMSRFSEGVAALRAQLPKEGE